MPSDAMEHKYCMKTSTKMILTGLLSLMTIVIVGEMFDAIGVAFGPVQAGFSAFAGIIGSLRLFSS